MSADLGFIEHFAHWHIAELQREAANDRLASLASGSGRPWRSQIAGWLYAIADRHSVVATGDALVERANERANAPTRERLSPA